MSILQSIYDIISAHYLTYRLSRTAKKINELKRECTDPTWIKSMEDYIRVQQKYIEGALLILQTSWSNNPNGFRIACNDAGYRVSFYAHTDNIDLSGIQRAFVSIIPIGKRCYDDIRTGFTLDMKLAHKVTRADIEKYPQATEEARLDAALRDACSDKDTVIEEVAFLEVGPGASVNPVWALTKDILSKIPEGPGESARTYYKLKDPDLSILRDKPDFPECLEPYGKLDNLHAELSSFAFGINHGIAKLKLTKQRLERDRLKRLYDLP